MWLEDSNCEPVIEVPTWLKSAKIFNWIFPRPSASFLSLSMHLLFKCYSCVCAWVQMCVCAGTHMCVLVGVDMYVQACSGQRLTSGVFSPIYLLEAGYPIGTRALSLLSLAGWSVHPRDPSVLVMRLQCEPFIHLFYSCAWVEVQSSGLHSGCCTGWDISLASESLSWRFSVLTMNYLSNLFPPPSLPEPLPAFISQFKCIVIFSTTPKLYHVAPSCSCLL